MKPLLPCVSPRFPALPAPPAICLFLFLLLAPSIATAQVTYPARPAEGQFITDAADLISDADETAIRQTAQSLLNDRSVPLIVVTIPSLADYGARGWTVERYAHNLYDEFGISSPEHNFGILLLVSPGDRQARIELGAGYTRERDAAAARIMNDTIVPQFRRDNYSGGIRQGVDALAQLARSNTPTTSATAAPATGTTPAPRAAPAPSSRQGSPSSSPMSGILSGGSSILGLLICGGIPIILIIFLATRLGRGGGASLGTGGGYDRVPYGYRNRRSSAGGFLGGMLLGGLMGHTMGRRSSSGGSRTFGGGLGGLGGLGGGGRSLGGGGGGSRSFGGGFSGRGGATGRW